MAGVPAANHRVVLVGGGPTIKSVPLAKRSAEQLQRTLVLAFPQTEVSLEKLAKTGRGAHWED